MPTYQIFTEYLLCASGSIYKEKYEMRFTIDVYGIARDIRH